MSAIRVSREVFVFVLAVVMGVRQWRFGLTREALVLWARPVTELSFFMGIPCKVEFPVIFGDGGAVAAEWLDAFLFLLFSSCEFSCISLCALCLLFFWNSLLFVAFCDVYINMETREWKLWFAVVSVGGSRFGLLLRRIPFDASDAFTNSPLATIRVVTISNRDCFCRNPLKRNVKRGSERKREY